MERIEIERLVATAETLGLFGGERQNARGPADFGARVADWFAGAQRDHAFEFAAALRDRVAHRG